MAVGVLALQGDFAAHVAALRARGVAARPVRTSAELLACDAFVVPGGESTTMLKLMDATEIAAKLATRIAEGAPTLATCAGVILLAREVTNPSQVSLGVLDVSIERNAYGRQTESCVAAVIGEPTGPWPNQRIEGVFIRAPRVRRVGPGVEILARRGDDPVLMRQSSILAATFHPELSSGSPILDLFVSWLRHDRSA